MEVVEIFGAGGHTRSFISLLNACKIKVAGIYDNSFDPIYTEIINSVKVIGTIDGHISTNKVVISIGDNLKRQVLFLSHRKSVFNDTICHPTGFIDDSVLLGKSNVFFANTFTNSSVRIGDNNIINTGVIIEHEVVIGSHNHISVGSIICGRVKIGDNCFIGAGAVIIDKVKICDDVTIGANAVVVNSINLPGVYVGNPVKKIK